MITYHSPLNYGICTCHAPLLLRKDMLQTLAMLREYCGFKVVRSHGILTEPIGVASRDSADKLQFHFGNVHKAYDNLLEIGLEPYIELSFMPKALAADETRTMCKYKAIASHPKSWDEWGQLVEALGRSLLKRYGAARVRRWLFEVWNEPNLPFFKPDGDRYEAYLKLYAAAAKGLKRADKRLQIGGPATARAEWAAQFADDCRKQRLPLDFVSTHIYTADEYEIYGGKARELFGHFEFLPKTVYETNAAVRERLGKDFPIYWTEWDAGHRASVTTPSGEETFWHPEYKSATWGKRIPDDLPFAGAFAAMAAGTMFNKGVSLFWWTGSDIYDEWGQDNRPYHGGRGIVTLQNDPKPSAHAHHFAHRLEGGAVLAQRNENGQGFITVSQGSKKLLLAWNVKHPELPGSVYSLSLADAKVKPGARSRIELVDETHANGRAAWEKLGQPLDLDPRQRAIIAKASRLEVKPLAASVIKSGVLKLPRNSFALVTA